MNQKTALLFLELFGNRALFFTEQLASLIGQAIEKTTNHRRLADQVNTSWDESVKIVEDIQKLNRPSRRARKLHQVIDKIIEEDKLDLPKEVSCKKGCSICCHLNVVVTNDEADLLFEKYDKSQDEKLKRQAAVTDDLKYPSILGYSDAACVFLKDNECSVYEDRPMACRSYRVISDPDECDAIKYPDHMVQQVVQDRIEMIKSIAYVRCGCDRLARKLLERKKHV